MRLAFLIYKYFPYGGLQRDMRRFAEEVIKRGHDVRIYFIAWQGEPLAGADLRQVPASAFSNHRRDQRFLQWVQADMARDPVDGVIGFNKMPGLDIYYAGDPCYLEKALQKRGPLYRRGGRFRHFAAWERAVFDVQSKTHILLLTESGRDNFVRHYQTPAERMTILPPGVALDRRAGEDALDRRRAARGGLGLAEQEFTLLFVGSGFITKGLDRAITALAHMKQEQPSVKARLLVVGQDKSRRFQRLARRLDVLQAVDFLGGRDDVAELMLAADLLVHPALAEAAGIVLLEAIAAGLPLVVTETCGYAHHVAEARAGIVLSGPFSQEQLDRAVMRFIDGVFRADCRQSALLYARLKDLHAMHSQGAELMLQLIGEKGERGND